MTSADFESSWGGAFVSKILPSLFMFLITLVATYVATQVNGTANLVQQMAIEQAKSVEALLAVSRDVDENRTAIASNKTMIAERTRNRFDTGDATRLEKRIGRSISDHETRLRQLERVIQRSGGGK